MKILENVYSTDCALTCDITHGCQRFTFLKGSHSSSCILHLQPCQIIFKNGYDLFVNDGIVDVTDFKALGKWLFEATGFA